MHWPKEETKTQILPLTPNFKVLFFVIPLKEKNLWPCTIFQSTHVSGILISPSVANHGLGRRLAKPSGLCKDISIPILFYSTSVNAKHLRTLGETKKSTCQGKRRANGVASTGFTALSKHLWLLLHHLPSWYWDCRMEDGRSEEFVSTNQLMQSIPCHGWPPVLHTCSWKSCIMQACTLLKCPVQWQF